MKAQAFATLPTSFCFVALNSFEVLIHLVLLSAKELISLFA
jgi:hypothetical protein